MPGSPFRASALHFRKVESSIPTFSQLGAIGKPSPSSLSSSRFNSSVNLLGLPPACFGASLTGRTFALLSTVAIAQTLEPSELPSNAELPELGGQPRFLGLLHRFRSVASRRVTGWAELAGSPRNRLGRHLTGGRFRLAAGER
jgi:hypothetical protein